VDVPLSPEAISSLGRQVDAFGTPSGREFGARFTVVKNASGGLMIHKIAVYPPVGH
jgi:hypothetical protein